MRHQRLFFLVVIGVLLLALAMFAIVVGVLGDEEDTGDGSDPSPRSAPGYVSGP